MQLSFLILCALIVSSGFDIYTKCLSSVMHRNPSYAGGLSILCALIDGLHGRDIDIEWYVT